MATWYLAKISVQQLDEKGNNKSISQSYLFDAVSYTDAEARVTAYVAPENPGFTLIGLTKLKLNEVFFIENNAETWFKSKVQYIVYDEKSQKEKLVPFLFLINAHDIKECYGQLVEKLGEVQDYLITDINVTKILDVIPYEEMEENAPLVETRNLRPLSEIIAAETLGEPEPDSEDIEDEDDDQLEETDANEDLDEEDLELNDKEIDLIDEDDEN
jgi:Domain of unknown function (DUF4494)